ncbi:MAG: methyltransferase-like protein 9 [Myxococcales bacterium]|nr:methyltransferase-like protein 9 [Myxococcales bacterium]
MRDVLANAGLRYTADDSRLLGPLRARFVQLEADESTRRWIERAERQPHGSFRMFLRRALDRWMSAYDANAWLDVHEMRVLGREQWSRVLGAERPGGRLLDVGAGDGRVTAELAPLFDAVVATETSKRMAGRLMARGFEVHRVDLSREALPDPRLFDGVSLLNVLDRTSFPLTLLGAALGRLEPGGLLLVAVPLPLRPHVHVGADTADPEELLPRPAPGQASSWEASASLLHEGLFAPAGLELLALSRAPYLSRGGRARPVSALDGSIFAYRKPSDRAPPRAMVDP